MYVIFKAKKVPRDVEGLQDENLKLNANYSAWMNTVSFENWIDVIWTSFSKRFPRTLLIMDSFKVHTSPSALKKLEELNTDVLIIPGGLTFYTQPLDVYVNGPVKARIKQYWQDYMISTEENPNTGIFNII